MGLSVQILSKPPLGDVAVRSTPDLPTEAVLRAILQSIDHGILLTDLQHRSLACNRRFGEMFGVEPADVVRAGVEELRERVAGLIVDVEGWRGSLEKVYARPDARYEDEILLRGAVETALRRVASPVYDEDGRLFGRLWTFTDVTAVRKRRRNSDLLRIVSTLADPDPGVNLKSICEAVTAHFGSATQLNILEGDFLRFHFNAGDMGPAASLPGIMRWDTYCGFTLADDKPLLVQDAVLDSRCFGLLPASVGFCRYLGVPVRDEAGRAIGTLCIVDQHMDQPLDDTDVELMELVAMRANAELGRERHLAYRVGESERRFATERREMEETRAVLAAMNDAFALLFDGSDTVSLLRELSGRLRGVLGYTASAIFLRRPGESCVHVVVWASGTEVARTFETSDFPPRVECTTDGPGLDVVFSQEGEVAELLGQQWAAIGCLPSGEWGEAVVALGRPEAPPEDSARHSIQLSALMDGVRLVLAAHALTQGLAQANVALRSAQEKAMRSEKLAVVGTLAASTAHDIRNITSSLSMLAMEGGDPAASLRAVREQLDRYSVLAHRLLSYARPGQVEQRPLAVAEMLERVLSLTSGQCRVSRVAAEMACEDGLPTILGDGHQLQHLFVNLVLNAVQAMDRSGGSLRLEAKATPAGMAILVIDDGPGIPEEIAERLFQPFASSRTQGFGLGLFSARRIAEAHGGTIEALRTQARGTTFVVTLPFSGGAE